MKNVKHKPMVAIMLEEMMPNCRIEGLDYINMQDYEWELDSPAFIKALGNEETQEKHTGKSIS